MSEVKTKKVTFDTSLPRGTCAAFTHEGERWIAYPVDKTMAISVVTNRMLGALNAVHDDLVRWVNDKPEDAARVMPIVARTLRAKELAEEKVRAWTL